MGIIWPYGKLLSNFLIQNKKMKLKGLRWWVIALICIATVINYIDRTAFGVMWPEMGKDLGMDEGLVHAADGQDLDAVCVGERGVGRYQRPSETQPCRFGERTGLPGLRTYRLSRRSLQTLEPAQIRGWIHQEATPTKTAPWHTHPSTTTHGCPKCRFLWLPLPRAPGNSGCEANLHQLPPPLTSPHQEPPRARPREVKCLEASPRSGR